MIPDDFDLPQPDGNPDYGGDNLPYAEPLYSRLGMGIIIWAGLCILVGVATTFGGATFFDLIPSRARPLEYKLYFHTAAEGFNFANPTESNKERNIKKADLLGFIAWDKAGQPDCSGETLGLERWGNILKTVEAGIVVVEKVEKTERDANREVSNANPAVKAAREKAAAVALETARANGGRKNVAQKDMRYRLVWDAWDQIYNGKGGE